MLALLALAIAGCGSDSPKDAGTPDAGHDAGHDAGTDAGEDAGPTCPVLVTERLTTDLRFPVYATAPAGDDRIFVLERTEALVRILDETGLVETPFLDLSATASTDGYEAGLLSLVFHPDYSANGLLYVAYTFEADRLRVSRFHVPAATPDAVDPASESLVIEVPQVTRHNTSGMLRFGPDRLLYVGLGDDDFEANGQDLLSFNGKILRLDVAVEPYEVPLDNPFVGDAGALPEVWAYGLREPYRFWFDDVTGDLYIADVGHLEREEVDVVPAGEGAGWNFGWPTMEGTLCHTPPDGCDPTGLVPPEYEYTHGDGTAIIGASPYRGEALGPCYQGRYFFGDYPFGWVKTFEWDAVAGAGDVRDEPNVLVSGLVSFGVDGQGEILIVGTDETLDRIVTVK